MCLLLSSKTLVNCYHDHYFDEYHIIIATIRTFVFFNSVSKFISDDDLIPFLWVADMQPFDWSILRGTAEGRKRTLVSSLWAEAMLELLRV